MGFPHFYEHRAHNLVLSMQSLLFAVGLGAGAIPVNSVEFMLILFLN